MRTAAILLVTAAGCGVLGQTNSRLEFEVASVRQAAPLARGFRVPRGGPGTADPGRVNYVNISMKDLLMTAYGIENYRVVGPAWLDSELYDIVATVPTGVTKEQVNMMLQNLLADRFQLTLHRETRDVPLYELVLAKNGSKLKLYVEDPNLPKPEPGRAFALDKNGVPALQPGAVRRSTSPGPRVVKASKQSLRDLADLLAGELGRPVVDKTGLAGDYDYSLYFLPEGAALSTAADSNATSLFVAVQEQLGLRLESKRGPIEMLVIDHAEKVPRQN